MGVSSGKGNLRTLTISLDGITVLETASAGLLQEVKGPALGVRKNQFPELTQDDKKKAFEIIWLFCQIANR